MFKNKYLSIVLALVVAIICVGISESYAVTKKNTKSKTTATAKKGTSKKGTSASAKKGASTSKGGKKSATTSGKKKTASSTTAKKGTAAGKSSGKRKTTGRATRKKRRRSNAINHKKYVAPVEVPQNDSLTLLVNEEVVMWVPENLNPGGLRVNSVKPDHLSRVAQVKLNRNFTFLPVSQELITGMKEKITSILPDSISGYDVVLNVGDRNYSYYITTVDKLPEKYRTNIPFVRPVNKIVTAKKGMDGDIVAMWHSHGRYFKRGKKATDNGAWLWQRPQLFGVTEDTHTLSYIVPYAVPMIENAGAYVLLPKERDVNSHEVIVDNDTNEGGQIFSQPYYKEVSASAKWTTGEEEGFIYDLPDFRDTENPFENGTYRQTTTVTNGTPSIAAWYADIPEAGEYAIYISYKSLPNSATDAHYTVNYSGGTREFLVNQTMGGGTWIYLGTFPLEAGYSDTEPIVTLTNLSKTEGAVVTADAIKIGGGMGNIARSNFRSDIYLDPSTPEEEAIAEEAKQEAENDPEQTVEEEENEEEAGEETEETEEEKQEREEQEENEEIVNAFREKSRNLPTFKTSGLPRFLEGARYWLHWAGIPEFVYSPYHGNDDYKDDYTSRGHWVNYLAGGSRVLPSQDGLKIPVDVTVALHSDAGKRADDSFIGTLGIYYTNGGDSYVDGTARANSRTLTDMLMRQITNDIRMTWEPNWTRRSMVDESYVEARVPEVPTSLIEFMSHQNFADMMYALDPAFRFTVGRSIYKAVGRFVAERKDRKFIVQPLPVKNFYIRKEKKGLYRLAWEPTPDRLEPTAMPSKYLVYERTGNELGFHLLGTTSAANFMVKIDDQEIHSFKIVAANDGGMSFPSETLALRNSGKDKTPVLIINGFTRVAGPAHFSRDGSAGFEADVDFGVPYIKDISFVGYQTEFRRNAGEAFGRSSGDYAEQVVAGNTFDYPYIHGVAIAETGRGFISTSVGAIVNGDVKLNGYKIIDLILGKQKTTVTGNGNTGMRFTAFPEKLQRELREFTKDGGDLFVSGTYIMSDLADYRSPGNSMDFASNVLGISGGEGTRPYSGKAEMKGVMGISPSLPSFTYSNTLNDKQYIVENPDIIRPSGNMDAQVFLTFSDNGQAAGVLTKKGNSKGAVMTIPFESISSKSERGKLMKSILDYFEK